MYSLIQVEGSKAVELFYWYVLDARLLFLACFCYSKIIASLRNSNLLHCSVTWTNSSPRKKGWKQQRKWGLQTGTVQHLEFSSAWKFASICCVKLPPTPPLFFILFAAPHNCDNSFHGEWKTWILKIEPSCRDFVWKLIGINCPLVWQCCTAFPARDGLRLGNVTVSDWGILRGDLHVTVNLHISQLTGTLQTLSAGCRRNFSSEK